MRTPFGPKKTTRIYDSWNLVIMENLRKAQPIQLQSTDRLI